MRFIYFITCCAATTFATTQTQAQINCYPAQAVRNMLTNKYKEQPIETIECNTQSVCERWINYDTGTWTWIIYPQDGVACYLATGDAGRQL